MGLGTLDESELIQINCCRLALWAMTLADIVMGSKTIHS